MESSRFLAIEFLDGKKESFIFPVQANSPAARKMRLEDFLQGQFVIVQLEHEVQLFPLNAIRSIRLSGFPGLGPQDEIGLPISAIRGAEQI